MGEVCRPLEVVGTQPMWCKVSRGFKDWETLRQQEDIRHKVESRYKTHR